MAMKRVYFRGRVLNQRTVDMVKRLEFNLLHTLTITQGSYNRGGVAQSAGTHDGGGAVDFWTSGLTEKQKRRVVAEARRVGFAWWLRRRLPGHWNEHFHGIALDDPEASYGARRQMVAFRNRRNGLANNGPDDGPWVGVHVWPVKPSKKVNVLAARRQFKKKKKKPKDHVRRIQWVLNEKVDAGLLVDGIAGPKTKAAYAKWERKMGAKKVDGLPNPRTLRALGRGWFNVGVLAWRKSKGLAKKKKK